MSRPSFKNRQIPRLFLVIRGRLNRLRQSLPCPSSVVGTGAGPGERPKSPCLTESKQRKAPAPSVFRNDRKAKWRIRGEIAQSRQNQSRHRFRRDLRVPRYSHPIIYLGWWTGSFSLISAPLGKNCSVGSAIVTLPGGGVGQLFPPTPTDFLLYFNKLTKWHGHCFYESR